jgi:protein O-GlcNAc transferase
MSAALQRKLSQAQQRLQEGDAAGAQRLCQEILQRAPRNPDALSLFAITLLMAGRANDAIAPLEQALTTQPRHGMALENLGLAHLMLGRFADAQRVLEIAATIPGAPASVFMRLGVALLSQDQLDAALAALNRALELDPANPDIHLNLGQAADRMENPALARRHFNEALGLSPNHVDAMFNLGALSQKEDEIELARAWFDRVLAQSPQHTDALFNLALIAQQQQRPDEAESLLRRAIKIDPSTVQVRNSLGLILAAQGRLEEARSIYVESVRIAPAQPGAREGLASVDIALGRFIDAIAHLREVLRIAGERPAIVAALADALFEVGELDEAAVMAERAISLDAAATIAYATLADVHSARGELALAAETLQTGVDRTGSINLLGKVTFVWRRLCGWEQWNAAWGQLKAALPVTEDLVSPFSLLCEPVTATEQLTYARRWSAQFKTVSVNEGCPRPARAERKRLRVGYFSSDFYEHATAYLLAEILELHDRTQFEVYAYSYGPDDNSPMRDRLRAACEHFVDIARDPDDVAVSRIRLDAPDILIDLKGYTLGARPSILAQRPCSIQISWLGYPGSMGAEFIDYMIADRLIVPPNQENNYTERVLRLPHCYQPNDRRRLIATTLGRPEYGLPATGFVFCAFNQTYKITPEIFACWMNLLRRTPDSVLWLLTDNRWATANLKRAAQGHGIDPARLIFAAKIPLAEHLARYRSADLALDTCPYGSHTTGSDALWAGCLFIALCGETFAARVSGSILNACNLPELIAYSLLDYERLALQIVNDEPFRQGLRAKLKADRSSAPLFDAPLFTRDLENIYREIVKRSAS